MKASDYRVIQDGYSIFVCVPDESGDGWRIVKNATMETIEAVRDCFLEKKRPDKKAYGFQWSCPNGKIIRLTVSVEDPGDGYSETQN